jgi:cell division protein ZapA (FtsZ GTPase activity inhibitor)
MQDEAAKPEAPSEKALEPLTITLGEQVIRLRVRADEVARYRQAAQLADSVLHDILDGGVVGGPRALAMAAFELAVELHEAHGALRRAQAERERIDRLVRRLEGVLRDAAARPGAQD